MLSFCIILHCLKLRLGRRFVAALGEYIGEIIRPLSKVLMDQGEVSQNALAFAQQRARLHALRVERCMKTVPGLRQIHTELLGNLSRLYSLGSPVPVASRGAFEDFQNDMQLVCDRFSSTVDRLEEIAAEDRTSRLSLESVNRAVKTAISQSARPISASISLSDLQSYFSSPSTTRPESSPAPPNDASPDPCPNPDSLVQVFYCFDSMSYS